MARSVCVLVLLAFVALACAQSVQLVDDGSIAQRTIFVADPQNDPQTPTCTANPCTKWSCQTDSTGHILGGTRKLEVGSTVSPADYSIGVGGGASGFISEGSATTSPGNARVRYDGDTCNPANTVTLGSMPEAFNLNLNPTSTGAFAVSIDAKGDVATVTLTVRFFGSSAGQVSTATISVAPTGSNPAFTTFTVGWSNGRNDFDNPSLFSGTLGAFQISWQIVGNVDFGINNINLLVQNSQPISGRVYQTCDCTSSDTSNSVAATVSLFSGASCSGSPLQTVSTGAGNYQFAGVSSGTYCVSVSGTSGSFCSAFSNSRTVTVGSSAVSGINFALQLTSGVNCPIDVTFTCVQATQTALANVPGPSGTGSCGGTGTFSSSDSTTAGSCSAAYVITRTYSSNGANVCTQRITVTDTAVGPVVTAPADFTASSGSTDPSVTGRATATDDCSSSVQTTFNDTTSSGCSASCVASTEIVRTWTGVDDCGNVGNTVTQQIFINGVPTTCPSSPVPVSDSPSPVPNNLNCRFICDEDSSASLASVAALLVVLLAMIALF